MHVFKDTEGRTWLVSINVTSVKRVRAMCGIDLYGLVDQDFEALGTLVGDPISLCDVLYCLCQDEAGKRNLTDEDFGRAMGGDVLAQAADAFLDELTDFFPDPRRRAGLKRVIAAGRQVTDRLIEHATLMLDSVDIEAEARKLMASSGSLPESSASTPAPSLSENSS